MERRHKILIAIIIFLIAWILLWKILPVGSGDWNNKQITKINSFQSSANFCFAVMGDNQIGFSTFNRILKDVNNKKPLFAINVGDLVQDGDKEKYRIFYDEIGMLQVPFLVSIGNHDIREEGRSNYRKIFGDFNYSFSYNNSLFIILDDANQEYIDQEQMQFLENELKKDYANKFVFLHVPPFDPVNYLQYFGKNISAEHSLSDKENARQFMDLVSNYNVTNVFTGHIHGYFNETKDNVNYIITGGAGGGMLLSNPEYYFFNYVNVCVNNSSVNYEVVKFPSPDPNIFDRAIYSAWLYIWYFTVTNKVVIVLTIIIVAFILDLIFGWIEKAKTKIKRKK